VVQRLTKGKLNYWSRRALEFGDFLRGILPYINHIYRTGMCSPKGYGFSAVLVINRVLILAILVINSVRFLHSSLELGMCFRSYFFIIIDKTKIKSPS